MTSRGHLKQLQLTSESFDQLAAQYEEEEVNLDALVEINLPYCDNADLDKLVQNNLPDQLLCPKCHNVKTLINLYHKFN